MTWAPQKSVVCPIMVLNEKALMSDKTLETLCFRHCFVKVLPSCCFKHSPLQPVSTFCLRYLSSMLCHCPFTSPCSGRVGGDGGFCCPFLLWLDCSICSLLARLATFPTAEFKCMLWSTLRKGTFQKHVVILLLPMPMLDFSFNGSLDASPLGAGSTCDAASFPG